MIIEQEYEKESKGNKPNLPIIQPWKGVNMIRIHSLRATIKEILQFAAALDVVRIGIIGNPATGKSTLGETIAHLIHKMSKDLPFAIKIFNKNNLINFRDTLKDLIPTNYILIFDDVSFLGANATRKQIEIIKQAITEIRHLPGGRDVKIIIIMNYHYTLGLDKYLRQADFRYFTSVGSSELDNMEKIVGGKNMEKVKGFQKLFQDAIVKHKFFFKLKTGKYFEYDYRKPFIPLLFYNNNTLRYVVSPTRYWIDKFCNICTQAQTEVKTPNSKPIADVMKEGERRFGGIWKPAIRLELLKRGIMVYSSKMSRAGKFLDQLSQQGHYSLEEIAAYYGMTITRSRLDKSLKVLSEDEQPKEEKPIEVK